MNFVILNGEILKKEEVAISHLLWEAPFVIHKKLWFGFGGIPFFKENIATIHNQLKVLNTAVPELLKNEKECFRLTKRILNKNKFYRSGIITFQLFIQKTGVDFVVSSVAFETFEFPFQEKGLLAGFSKHLAKPISALNKYKFYNRAFEEISKAEDEIETFESTIVLNEKGMVCEGISSNVYMIKNKQIITPSLKTGCYPDVLRTHILDVSKGMGLEVLESEILKKQDVFEMNEIFLASEVTGIQWIMGINNKRFVHIVSDQIHQKLNDFLKYKVS